MSASGPHSELRLVVLGRTGTGKTSAVRSILGLEDLQQDPEDCWRLRGQAAGRQVVVVHSPDWFGSSSSPDDRRRHISSLITFSSPGPHAFLLCVPVNQSSDGETQALDVLNKLFGSTAVNSNTVVLFTHMDELEEDEELEEYLVTWRKDLRELVERCGDRYHTLETRRGEAEMEGKAVEELMEKVEQLVKESGVQHFSCPLYQEVEGQLREKQLELVRQRRGEASEAEFNMTDEEEAQIRAEAERSIGDLNVDVHSVFPSDGVLAPAPVPAPSFLWGLWEKLTAWTKWLPRCVRREALLGALVGLFVGGPFGGMVGATVGSVATEVRRRKTQKHK